MIQPINHAESKLHTMFSNSQTSCYSTETHKISKQFKYLNKSTNYLLVTGQGQLKVKVYKVN